MHLFGTSLKIWVMEADIHVYIYIYIYIYVALMEHGVFTWGKAEGGASWVNVGCWKDLSGCRELCGFRPLKARLSSSVRLMHNSGGLTM